MNVLKKKSEKKNLIKFKKILIEVFKTRLINLNKNINQFKNFDPLNLIKLNLIIKEEYKHHLDEEKLKNIKIIDLINILDKKE